MLQSRRSMTTHRISTKQNPEPSLHFSVSAATAPRKHPKLQPPNNFKARTAQGLASASSSSSNKSRSSSASRSGRPAASSAGGAASVRPASALRVFASISLPDSLNLTSSNKQCRHAELLLNTMLISEPRAKLNPRWPHQRPTRGMPGPAQKTLESWNRAYVSGVKT